MADENQAPRYTIMAHKDPDILSSAVSTLLNEGWRLHGELKLQAFADESSLTFTRLIYIQALWLPKEETNA